MGLEGRERGGVGATQGRPVGSLPTAVMPAAGRPAMLQRRRSDRLVSPHAVVILDRIEHRHRVREGLRKALEQRQRDDVEEANLWEGAQLPGR